MDQAKKIMLLGAGGQLGQAFLAQSKPADWEVLAFTRADLDLNNHNAVRHKVQTELPDLIINAAAFTAVDKAEQEKDAATAANFHAPANLAALCSAHDIPLIHISTDYVFDGDHNTPYRTDDAMNPVNFYGESKLMGEEAVRHELAWHIILRVSSVFSAFGKNLLTNTLKLIDEKDELRMVTDQIACPTYAVDVAAALIIMGQAVFAGRADIFGTYHLCGTPQVSRFEFVQAIMDTYAPYAKKLPKLSPALSAEFASYARRPAYAVLNCSKTERLFNITQRDWREGIKDAIETLMRAQQRSKISA